MGACSTPSAESLAQNDPWEKTNRDVFDFDVKLDHAVARPIAKVYRSAVPEPARDGIHNALTNLNSPVVLANDVLQGDGDKAANTFGRFVINSTVGLGGLIDVASKIGIPGHDNDFGITLGKAGVAEGSYLVLPFAGPKPPRDLVGTGVDIAFDPLTYISWNDGHLNDDALRPRHAGQPRLAAGRGGVHRAVVDRFLRHHPQPVSPEPRCPDQWRQGGDGRSAEFLNWSEQDVSGITDHAELRVALARARCA